jgi:hypothetical protein
MGDYQIYRPIGVTVYPYGSEANRTEYKTFTPSSGGVTYHYGSTVPKTSLPRPQQVRTNPPPAEKPQTPPRQPTRAHSDYAKSSYPENLPRSTPAEQREFLQSIRRFGDKVCALLDNKYDYCK